MPCYLDQAAHNRMIRISVSLLTLMIAVACGQLERGPTSEPGFLVTGQVVEVVALNIDELETVGVKDSDGKIWMFTTEKYVGMTPSHLKEHQLFGDVVTITYEERDRPEGIVLVAVWIQD